ncbi:MAG: hypothetical protein IJ131_02710 [Eggerthellaceae bacterium]|nr:hypothetical protein [Eggerthellaceae bacterium]
MTDSIILERVSDVAADCVLGELLRTEDFEAFEQIVATDTRLLASMVLSKCVERFGVEGAKGTGVKETGRGSRA